MGRPYLLQMGYAEFLPASLSLAALYSLLLAILLDLYCPLSEWRVSQSSLATTNRGGRNG